MDIYLHIGAHRAASTSFQYYMRENAAALARRNTAFWGPARTRNGMFHGIMPVPSRRSMAQQMARARGRIALKLAKLEDRGFERLVISDENMLGSMRANMRDGALYRAAGQRMARYHAGFGTEVRRVGISLRSPESYWRSAMGYCLMRLGRLPEPEDMLRLAAMPRGWRDVVMDVACAMPGVEIVAMPHETMGHDAAARLGALLDTRDVPRESARVHRNAGPGPVTLRAEVAQRAGLPVEALTGADALPAFGRAQLAAMRESYEDDLYWLRAGADGLARICEEWGPETAGINPAPGPEERGQGYGTQGRRLA
ncbi:hypothetical protein K1T73_10600 [Roseovarius sp. SCSIO 43702]|uniref:hypothetical protein n=1 Tax=Roseovarius sp. SCSIO 43702 TaxID=2823043 RepID=UPI001C73AA29|nr:hypothetical protein [Roseovarius sp. SCSIO 43702]QYX55548.1 hypothetical protein K1T73_10600 [Roseovarius sp. SCSIO 43702]